MSGKSVALPWMVPVLGAALLFAIWAIFWSDQFSDSATAKVVVSGDGREQFTDKGAEAANADIPQQRSTFGSLNYPSRIGALPETLKDTRLQASLAVDDDGHLRVSSDLRMVFDYFLSAVTEESVDTIIARIDEYLSHHLESPALEEARNILHAYISLKQSLYDYELERSDQIRTLMEMENKDASTYLAMLENQLSERNALRSEHLPADVHEAFYAREEAYDRYTLERMRINADGSLSDADKQELLVQLDTASPDYLVAERQEAQKLDTLMRQTQSLRKAGADENDIEALRRDMYGEEASERFAKLDQERAEWNARLQRYIQERDAILANPGLGEADKQTQIQSLLESGFDEREQIRVKVQANQA